MGIFNKKIKRSSETLLPKKHRGLIQLKGREVEKLKTKSGLLQHGRTSSDAFQRIDASRSDESSVSFDIRYEPPGGINIIEPRGVPAKSSVSREADEALKLNKLVFLINPNMFQRLENIESSENSNGNAYEPPSDESVIKNTEIVDDKKKAKHVCKGVFQPLNDSPKSDDEEQHVHAEYILPSSELIDLSINSSANSELIQVQTDDFLDGLETASNEFRQFVFDSDFQSIEGVVVERSDSGAGDSDGFRRAAVATVQKHSEKKFRLSPPKQVQRLSGKKPTANVASNAQDKMVYVSTNPNEKHKVHNPKEADRPLFCSPPPKTERSREDKVPPPKKLFAEELSASSKDDTRMQSKLSGTKIIMSPPPDKTRRPRNRTQRNVGAIVSHQNTQKLHVKSNATVDRSFVLSSDFSSKISSINESESSRVPEMEWRDNILWELDDDPFQVGQEETAFESLVIETKQGPEDANAHLIVAIQKASSKEPRDPESGAAKPDPSPRGVPQTRSDSELEVKRQKEEIKHPFSDGLIQQEIKRSAQPDFVSPKRKIPSKQTILSENAILGSMLFRQTEATVPAPAPTRAPSGSSKKSKQDVALEGSSRIRFPVPPSISTGTDPAASVVSSVTEDASSFYQKNFQAWRSQASSALNNYHHLKRHDTEHTGNSQAPRSVSSWSRNTKGNSSIGRTTFLDRVEEEHMRMFTG